MDGGLVWSLVVVHFVDLGCCLGFRVGSLCLFVSCGDLVWF